MLLPRAAKMHHVSLIKYHIELARNQVSIL